MVRTYKTGVPVVTMATQSLLHTELGGTEAQNLEDIVAAQGNGSKWAENLPQPQAAWQPLVPRLRGSSCKPGADRRPILPLGHLNGSLLFAPKPPSKSIPNPEPLFPQYSRSLHVGQSI